ncbi:MAG: hypothetical protein HZA61_10005, partial [Candidatus Eisenbacteria bacterium]|nr:hypothetical protein [Candidatus Eisenbacteria bacterium]
RHEAAKRIGVDEVAAKREVNERARAHERAAKQREERRARERAVAASHVTTDPDSPAGEADAEAAEFAAALERARRQSDVDTVAALRWMGVSLEEAQLAAERTKDLADGPTGERVMIARRFCSTRFGRKQDFRRKPDSETTAPTAASEHAA